MPDSQATHAANADALELAAAESAFAQHSARAGMREAFLAHFADDGVFVRGSWIAARPWLSTHPDAPVLLEWKPVHTEVAASGELGLSTGPWRLTRRDDPAARPAFGQFVSVWRREPGGPWKVIVDLGISHAEPVFWDAPLEAAAGSNVTAPSEGAEQAEKRFEAAMLSAGAAASYDRFASPRLRRYREGAAPVAGRANAMRIAAAEAPVAFTLEHCGVSRSGEFAYARGSVAAAASPGKPIGHFMRVWRVEDGEWRIVMDVVQAS